MAERALACLERFGQRLRGMPPENVWAVGTNTLRQVRPEAGFLERAEAALGHSIDVIAGREEARLVYLGVAHGLAAGSERRLVVDIGGGSTEVIVGEGFEAEVRESLHMGCVSMSQRWFSEDKITARLMDKAELAGALEVRPGAGAVPPRWLGQGRGQFRDHQVHRHRGRRRGLERGRDLRRSRCCACARPWSAPDGSPRSRSRA